MFTGIIKNFGTLVQVEKDGKNLHLSFQSDLTKDLSIDQSVAHNGVCLTVVAIEGDVYKVTAVDETLQKTTLGQWETGKLVNLELALQLGTRLDGHVVQGHVDGTGICKAIEPQEGSHVFTFEFSKEFAPLIIEKGSICVNGVSLTAFNVTENNFQVAIIPYTFSHTTFHQLKIGESINLEFDLLGKYFLRHLQLSKN
jgi:riboflavin synthase